MLRSRNASNSKNEGDRQIHLAIRESQSNTHNKYSIENEVEVPAWLTRALSGVNSG